MGWALYQCGLYGYDAEELTALTYPELFDVLCKQINGHNEETEKLTTRQRDNAHEILFAHQRKLHKLERHELKLQRAVRISEVALEEEGIAVEEESKHNETSSGLEPTTAAGNYD